MYRFIIFCSLRVSHFQLSRHRSWRGFSFLVSQVFRISLNSNVQTFTIPSFWDLSFYEFSSFEVLEPPVLKVPGSSIFFKGADCNISWLWRCVISVLCKLGLPKFVDSQLSHSRDLTFLGNLTPPNSRYAQFVHSVQSHTSEISVCTVFTFLGSPISVKSDTSEISVFTVFTFSGFPISVKSHTSRIHGFTVSTFSDFRISVQSHTTDIYGFTVFAFFGLRISVQSHTYKIYEFTVFEISGSHIL